MKAAKRPRSTDVPDILVLPPVLVGGALLVGIGIHYLVMPILVLPIVLARALGASIFLASGILAHLAHSAMTRVGTNILPTRPALALATDGPFRFTRNPLYVAALGVYLGISLWVDGVAPLVLLIPVAWLLHRGVVLPEERYLAAKFGAPYETYRASVRRWL